MSWNLERSGVTACGITHLEHPRSARAFSPACRTRPGHGTYLQHQPAAPSCPAVQIPHPRWTVWNAPASLPDSPSARPCAAVYAAPWVLLAGRDQVWGLLPVLRLPGNPIAALPAAHLPLLPQLNYIRLTTRKSSLFKSIYVFATTISEESAKSQIIINESENNFHLLYWLVKANLCTFKFQLTKNFLNGGTVTTPIIPHICQIISTTEISDRANFSYALHKKFTSWCPTTPFWVEALFYLCCVGTGTGYLPQSTPTIQTHQKHELATQ